MRIALDARGINWYHGTGIGTYTENILLNLINIDKKNDYYIYWSGKNYNKFKRNNSHIIMSSKKHHRFFEDYFFPYNNLNKDIDVYHVPQNGIGLSSSIKCNKIVTVHDLIPYIMPKTVGKGYLTKFLQEVPKIIRNSDAIITVSECSKQDILKFFPIDPNKIYVTPLAADKIYKPLKKENCKIFLKNFYNIDCPFVLYIGGFSTRKNVENLVLSFKKVCNEINENYKLVIAGSLKDNGKKLVELCEKLNISNKVIFPGFIPESHLPIFYNSCDVFVYPSLYEGFGLPPLEAMRCMAPVITSNISSIPEVVGNSGILINPLNKEDLTIALGKILTNASLRKFYARKGYIRALDFSWERTALETLKVYNSFKSKTPSIN